MRPTRRAILTATATATATATGLSLAGCLDAGDGGSDTTEETTTEGTTDTVETVTTTTASEPTVRVRSYSEHGEILGDADGQGAGDVWWVLRPDGTPVKPETTTDDSGNGNGGY